MRGGYGAWVFRCDVCLSFVSMVVFAEGKGGDMRGRGNTHGREWTSVAIDGRIEGWEEGFDAVSFILLFLPLVSSVERASWSIVGLVSVREQSE